MVIFTAGERRAYCSSWRERDLMTVMKGDRLRGYSNLVTIWGKEPMPDRICLPFFTSWDGSEILEEIRRQWRGRLGIVNVIVCSVGYMAAAGFSLRYRVFGLSLL